MCQVSRLQRKLGSERGKEDSSCLCMLHLPSFLWSLCGAFSGRSGKNCEGRQPVNQSLALTQGANAHSVVNTSGMCRGLQGELSFDEPFMPVIAQTVETQHDSCLQECDQVVDAALSQNHRGFRDLDASILPTGASKDLNHLVTRKGPAVAGERPNCKVDYYCKERSTGQEADPSVPSPCQVPAGEVTGAVQCVCSAGSGCQVPEGHELPLPHRSCCMSQGTARGLRARFEADDTLFAPSQCSLPLGHDVVPGCKAPASQAQVPAGHSCSQPPSKLMQMPEDNRQCHEYPRCWGLRAEFSQELSKLGNVTCIHCLQVRAVQSVVSRLGCETCRGLTLPWIQDSHTFDKLHCPGQGHVEVSQAPPHDHAGVADQGASPILSVGQADLHDAQDSCSTGLGAQQGLPIGQVCVQCCSASCDGAEQGQGAGQAGVQDRGTHAMGGDCQGSPKGQAGAQDQGIPRAQDPVTDLGAYKQNNVPGVPQGQPSDLMRSAGQSHCQETMSGPRQWRAGGGGDPPSTEGGVARHAETNDP